MNKTRTKYAPGTIGHTAARIARKYGHTTAGLIALEFALEEATGARSILLEMPDGTQARLSDTPAYKAIAASEREIIDSILGKGGAA